MNGTRSSLPAGFSAALSHRRLAVVLWLALAIPGIAFWVPLAGLAKKLDASPFRETLLAGWDSWGMLAVLAFDDGEWRVLLPAFLAYAVLFLLAHLFVTGGAIRTVDAGIARPVFRKVVADGAALFRPSLWAFSRYLLTLAVWTGLLVAIPIAFFGRLAGDDAPPNGFWTNVSVLWGVLVGSVVFLNVTARFHLARIALARDFASNARGAYRVAKQRLRGHRGAACGLVLFWLVAGLAIQALFTNVGVRLNPSTEGGVFGLFVVRQFGFVVLAATTVGLWGSLLAFEESRRPQPRPIPAWTPIALTPAAPSEAPEKIEPDAPSPGEPEPEGSPTVPSPS